MGFFHSSRIHIVIVDDVQDYSYFGRMRGYNYLNQFFKGLLALQVKTIFPDSFHYTLKK